MENIKSLQERKDFFLDKLTEVKKKKEENAIKYDKLHEGRMEEVPEITVNVSEEEKNIILRESKLDLLEKKIYAGLDEINKLEEMYEELQKNKK